MLRIALPSTDNIFTSIAGVGFTTGAFGVLASVGTALSPSHFTRIGNRLIVEGGTPGAAATRQLWVIDGTNAALILNTPQLVRINPTGDAFPATDVDFPGPAAAAVLAPVLFNGFVYLPANDGVHGTELWRTDGTSAGTSIFADVNPVGAGNPQNLTVSGNFLYFTADDGVHGRELWKTNGTTTQMVADLSPGLNATTVSQMTDVGGKLFFTAATTTSVTTSPPGLFVTDGTTVTPLPDAVGSAQAAAFNGKLYFQGGSSDPVHGAELWVSDGTAAGTHLAADIDTQSGPGGTNLSSNPTGLTVFNGALYFAANDGIHGNELWKFDGTTASLVKDINPVGANPANPANLTVVGNHLFFTADDGIHGVELWVTDGTSAGTHLVRDINTNSFGSASSNPNDLQNVDGTLFFAATDGSSANASTLYKADATTAVVVSPGNTYVTTATFHPFGFFDFPAADDVNGDGILDLLWRTAGGEVDGWIMHGGHVGSGTAVGSLSSAWQFAGAGDFTGSGTNGLVWRNTVTGEVDSWLVSNGTISGGNGVGSVSSAWQPLATGDFNDDGISDVAWRNTSTGEVDTWLMNDGHVTGGSAVGSVSSAWKFAGTGDFDGNGATDMLWHNTATGEVDTWLMSPVGLGDRGIDGGRVIGGRALGSASSAWQALGAGKFSGNGPSDILWRNTATGEVDIWFVNGDQMTGGTVVGSVSSAWQFVGIGDVTGSGGSDIIWRNTVTGEVDTWLINNGHISGGTAIGAVSSASTPLTMPTA